MKDARKLFRLAKWINEIQKTMELLEKPPSDADEFELILSKKME